MGEYAPAATVPLGIRPLFHGQLVVYIVSTSTDFSRENRVYLLQLLDIFSIMAVDISIYCNHKGSGMADVSMGERLKRLRELRGFSQSELARRAGVTHPVISDLERGVRQDMTVSTAKKLAAALGVSLEMLVGDVESECEPAALALVGA
jgi:DNA-binding XRE family transcriptional regulator